MMTVAQKIISFYTNLKPPQNLPNDITWLHPQKNSDVIEVVTDFYNKYFNDNNRRTLMLGINPGRHGAGITGVNFTAAKQLTQYCNIQHPFKGSELSAEFIYDMIMDYGGVQEFYNNHFIGSLCPLGFVKGGKNINYYDDKELLQLIEPFIIESIKQNIDFNINTDVCYAIGGEKNFKYLSSLNNKYHFFKTIVPLPHPRFIMQYRRKQKKEFIDLYINSLKNK
jgi:hypothetical protein